MFFVLGLFACAPVENLVENITERFSSEQELDHALMVTEDFFEAIMEHDYQAAYALISDSDKKEKSFEDFEHELRNVPRIESVHMNWVEVRNNIAVVNIDLVDDYDGTQKTYTDLDVSLVKEEDGSWRINFWP